jgi:hypothetical protein
MDPKHVGVAIGTSLLSRIQAVHCYIRTFTAMFDLPVTPTRVNIRTVPSILHGPDNMGIATEISLL